MATKSMPNVKLNVQFTKATTLANIVSEENIVASFGKLALWYDKLAATHAFTNNIGVNIATPGTSDSGKFLKADGSWATPTNTNTTYTLKGAYGSSSNTWVTTLTPSSGSATTSTVPSATTAAYGITKLSDTIADSSNLAATPKMVKSVNDKLANYMLTSTYVGSDGVILPAKLPSYVDDVIDGYYSEGKFYEEAEHTTEITGETGKIYVDLSTNATYRWSGSTWVNISNPLDADRGLSLAGGKIGHANAAVTAVTTAALKKIAYDAYGHITSSAAPTAADLTSIIGDASASSKGVMTTAQVTKLNGIATGAEVNQNAFSNVKVGEVTVAADSKTDTVTFSAGNFVTLTGDASNDTVTFAVKQMTGATDSAAGTGGAVPAPAAGKQTSFLRGDGTWVVPTNTDTKVTITNLPASTDNKTYYPTFAAAAGTSGVNIINTSYKIEHSPGTASTTGGMKLTLGNSTASGTANNEEGAIKIYSSGTGAHTLMVAPTTTGVIHTFPATAGTVLNSGTTSFTQTLTSGTQIGSIKIDGTTTTLYAPTNTNTTYTFAEGSTNGAFSVTPSGGSATSVKIHGLGSAAYTASTAYVSATATHTPNTVFAGPSSGTKAAAATFRALVAADIPSIPKSKISDFPASLKNPNALTIKGNGTASFTYDGSAAKTLNIKSGTGISVTSDTSGNITIASSVTNTDTKVTQSETTTANYRPLILGATSNADPTKLTTTATDEVYATDGLYVQPSTGALFAKQINVTNDIRSTGNYVPYTTGGTAGYYCAIQFKITATYLDCPIELTMSDRGSTMMTRVTVRFASADSTDPALALIRYRGAAMDVYACKSATSTWQIWVKCPSTYSRLTVHDVYCSHMSKMTISHPDTFMTTSAFTTAIASGGSLATNTKATIGTEYYVGSSTRWTVGRNINGLVVDGSANRVNYGTCSTAAGTAAKTVACTGYALITGSEITVKFSNTNTAVNPTLNVNSTGAKAIYYRGAAITAGFLTAAHTYTFRYNGSQYELVGDIANTVQQNNLNVNTNTNQGLKLPLLLSAKSAATNKFTDSTNSAVGCSSITGQASMTGLAWLETNYYTTAGTAGKSYATICAEHFRTVGDGYFMGDALSARSLSKNPKINGVVFDGATNMSILKALYSGTGSSTVTLTDTADNYDLLIITITNTNGKSTIFHRTSEQYVRHPYCNTPNPAQSGMTSTIIGSMMTTVSGTSLKVEVSNIIITGSGSTVTAASATRTATITEVYGLKFS